MALRGTVIYSRVAETVADLRICHAEDMKEVVRESRISLDVLDVA
jgi:hypothetical protein